MSSRELRDRAPSCATSHRHAQALGYLLAMSEESPEIGDGIHQSHQDREATKDSGDGVGREEPVVEGGSQEGGTAANEVVEGGDEEGDEEQEEEEEEDEDEDEDEDDDDDEEDEDEEPKLKYARLTQHLTPVYRNGDATSTFLVAGDKMVQAECPRESNKEIELTNRRTDYRHPQRQHCKHRLLVWSRRARLILMTFSTSYNCPCSRPSAYTTPTPLPSPRSRYPHILPRYRH